MWPTETDLAALHRAGACHPSPRRLPGKGGTDEQQHAGRRHEQPRRSRQLSAVLDRERPHFSRRPGSWPVHAKLRPGLRVRLLDRLNAREQGRSGGWQSTLREPGFVNGLRLAHVGLPRRRYAHFDRRRCSQQTTNRDPSDPPVARSLPTPLWRRTSRVTISVAHCRRSAFRLVMSRLPSFTPGSHRGRDFRCSCRFAAEKSDEFTQQRFAQSPSGGAVARRP